PAGTVLVPDAGAARPEPASDFRDIPDNERQLQGAADPVEPAFHSRSISVNERQLPGGARPLAACVGSSVPGLEPVLGRLLGATVVVDASWEQALAVALANPDLVVVTPDGDRLDGRGAWHAGGAAIGATPAAAEEARR